MCDPIPDFADIVKGCSWFEISDLSRPPRGFRGSPTQYLFEEGEERKRLFRYENVLFYDDYQGERGAKERFMH